MSLLHKRRVAAGCLAVLVAGCGTATSGGASHISPSTTTTTLMTGWQQKFDLDWQVKPEPGGTQRIQGYLVSRPVPVPEFERLIEARRVVQTLEVCNVVAGDD